MYLSPQDKARFCGIYPSKTSIRDFVFEDFYNVLIKSYELQEYSIVLFNFGCACVDLFEELKKRTPEFDEQDRGFEHSKDMFGVLKFLFENQEEGIDIRLLPKGKKNGKEINANSTSSKRLVSAIIKTIQEEMSEMDNDKYISMEDMDKEIISGKNREWVRSWTTKHNGLPSVDDEYKRDMLHEDYSQHFGKQKEITLEYVNDMLKLGEKKDYNIYGIKRGQPIDVFGLTNHVWIQNLALLLRLNTFLSLKEKGIDNVSLTDKQCAFIYDFLNYFNVYSFSDAKSDNTSTKEKIIRARYNNFPSKNNPKAAHVISLLKSDLNKLIQLLQNSIETKTD